MGHTNARSLLLALDQGTTSSRALVFGLDGRTQASSQLELQMTYPQPGWVEQDPGAILATEIGCATSALAAVGTAGEVAAIGIANQRETTIVWERASGRPIAPAIVWQDRRTADVCRRLREDGVEPDVRRRTGVPIDPYFSATKIAWLLDHVSGARRRAERGDLAFGTVDSWLIWHLTEGGVHATDVTNASRTMLFNIRSCEWDEELLRIFRVPVAMLPEVRPSAGHFGTTRVFGGERPIVGVAGDQQAALMGQTCLEPGHAKNTYGTGAFVLMNTGGELKTGDGVVGTIAWQIAEADPIYALEGSIFVAGAAVQWLRDGLGLIRSAADIEPLAARVPDSGGIFFVPALAGLGAPFWDPYARGTMVGLTRGTTAAHLARATLEAIAFRTRDAIDAMTATSGRLLELRVDGGAARNNLLLQIQADVLGVPVVRPTTTETTALGAAMLAGIGAGVLPMSGLPLLWHEERRFEPALDPAERERRYAEWQRACTRARAWAATEAP
ncbi:MAG TPA: glycerol kinase GlpK [Vicinamibacterales bacterium]|jgi:glycerol kinase